MAVQEKLYTVEEFEEFLSRDENSERLFELINGEIVEKVPTEEHSVAVGNIFSAFREFSKPKKLGRVGIEVRHGVEGDAYNDLIPDVAFTASERLLPVVKEGAVPHMPDIAVEVKSPRDSLKKMREKANYYLANGTKMVWLVYPEKRLVTVLTPTSEDILTENDTLTGGDVLPEFTLAVRDIFEE
jgi:Uma2 family endonuclease